MKGFTRKRPALTVMEKVLAENLVTAGIGKIINIGDLEDFTGATVPALPSETYDIDIEVDGTNYPLAVAILDTDDWDGIVTKIVTALQTATSSTETVAIVGGEIVGNSATEGDGSDFSFSAGTTGSAGGDLLTAINALGADYQVDLVSEPGSDAGVKIFVGKAGAGETFGFMLQVKTDTGQDVSGLVSVYEPSTGEVVVKSGAVGTLALNQQIIMSGYFLKVTV